VLSLTAVAAAPGFQDSLGDTLNVDHDVRFIDPDRPVTDQLADIDVVVDIGRFSDGEALIRAAPRLRLWQVMGTGTDHVPVRLCESAGVRVANCPGETGAIALAEQTFYLMLTLARRAAEARVDPWRQVMATELAGRTLGLVGLGASACEVARRARAFGMSTIALTRDGRSRAANSVDRVMDIDAIDSVLPQLDIVSLHVPLNTATRGLLNARRIALLRPHALVINVSRGGLIDEQAVAAALCERRIGGAGLDTFDHEPLPASSPLLSALNVVLTPHMAGRTVETARRRMNVVRENCRRLAVGAPLQHLVRAVAG